MPASTPRGEALLSGRGNMREPLLRGERELGVGAVRGGDGKRPAKPMLGAAPGVEMQLRGGSGLLARTTSLLPAMSSASSPSSAMGGGVFTVNMYDVGLGVASGRSPGDASGRSPCDGPMESRVSCAQTSAPRVSPNRKQQLLVQLRTLSVLEPSKPPAQGRGRQGKARQG